MTENTEEQTIVEGITRELQEQAKQISEALRLFADYGKRLAEDLAEFDKRRKEVRERIDREARQTDGRIV